MTEQELKDLFLPQLNAGLTELTYWVKSSAAPPGVTGFIRKHNTVTDTWADLLAELEYYTHEPNTIGRPTFIKD